MNPVKVMIVDDEVLAIEHMRQLIGWQSLGYEIVCTTTKPSQVSRLAREHRPELILMDIVMPGTDGLALSRELLAEGLALKIVLLTSYKEFEYAKEAVKLGVSNYWVKHEMDAEAVKRELGGLREEIENQRRQRKNDQGRLLVGWLGGRPLTDPQWQAATGDGTFDRFHLLVLQPDRAFPVLPGVNPEAPELPAEWPGEEEAGLLVAVRFLEGCFVLIYGDHGSRGEAKMRERLEEKAGEARRRLEEATGGTVSVAMAYALLHREEVPQKLAEALKRLEQSFFVGSGQRLRLNELPPHEERRLAHWEWEEGLARIRGFLADKKYGEASREAAQLFDQVGEARDRSVLADLYRQLITALNRSRSACGLPSVAEAWAGGAAADADWTTFDGVCKLFLTDIQTVAAADAGMSAMSRKVRQAMEHMDKHYADPDLDADAIARQLGISRDHLRHLFKEETGMTVLDRLTDMRIERAKQLLDEGTYKIYEIAERVGFRSSQYFSQVFRKVAGMTPLDYMERRG
jgi:two-component system response regulator YesN